MDEGSGVRCVNMQTRMVSCASTHVPNKKEYHDQDIQVPP